ncbi:MAG: chorismate synthase, partial [Microbacterium gubbeenense]
MLRWITAGESHGPELIATLEGLPAGVPLTVEQIQEDLERRKLGAGRGARMKFEKDALTLSAGVVHGVTIGSPLAIR